MEIMSISAAKIVEAASRQAQARQHSREELSIIAAGVNQAADQQAAEPAPREALTQAMEQLKQTFKVEVRLEVDEESGRDVVKILSSDGERLIRQIPPKAAIAMAHKARNGHLEGILDSLA